MSTTDNVGENQYREGWQETSETRRFVAFDFNDLEWTKVKVSADGHEFDGIPDTIAGKVDFAEFHDFGMWTAYVDAGSFNVLGVKLAPNYTIPRHHHNIDQLVLVHEGEVWQGSQRYQPGEAYFTRAGHAYSLTAGDQGATVFEIRSTPLAELKLWWDEADPNRWVHGRRPGRAAQEPLTPED